MSTITLGLLLIILGMLLVLISVLLPLLRRGEEQGGEEERRAEAGGVVLIGPIPIVFGTSQKMAQLTIILAILLMAMAIILFALLR
ncbi:TIGR00304 family membrane protein [Pyrobaculum aerophilum]|mgnify:CR=1 FL=1|uniref:TIGR00304 family membrane protein n=1 Tax=Pyrobaculum aerophilum TaxID=13773 RepID=UPI00257D0380|nr:TIGR00304 family protein [Pyrobaculum sp.]